MNLCTQSGSSYLMMISSMLTSMEWFYSVKMELNDIYIQGYLHILRTTLKSELLLLFWLYLGVGVIHMFDRVLLATIRDQGICPCPHCLIPKPRLNWLGLISDSKNRIDKACKSDTDSVNKAQKAIYELGKPIGGVYVQQLLKASSVVPISVSLRYTCTI